MRFIIDFLGLILFIYLFLKSPYVMKKNLINH